MKVYNDTTHSPSYGFSSPRAPFEILENLRQGHAKMHAQALGLGRVPGGVPPVPLLSLSVSPGRSGCPSDCPSRVPMSLPSPSCPSGVPRVPPASLGVKVLSLGGVPLAFRLDWTVSPTLSPKERVSPLSWPFQVCVLPKHPFKTPH